MSLRESTAWEIDARVAAAQAAGRVPTCAVAVVRGGELAHVAVAGDPAGPDVQFRIGSITKTLTAALVLQLRDAGRLSLDDLLYRHLPGTAVGGVTLRQLLGHCSGLQREPDGPWWEQAPGVELADLLAGVTPDKLAHPPYRSPHYSNLAYGLLGAVVCRVTGDPWPELATQRLLRPLGLSRTSYHPQEPFVPGYLVHPWYDTRSEEPRYDSGAMAPAGQLWSTLTDLGRWAGFLADPDPAVLAPATLAEMCAPVAIYDPDRWTAGHGLGLGLWRHGERVYVGHGGSMPGYLAMLLVHRQSGTGTVGFANAYTLHGTTLVRLGTELLTLVLEREPPVLPTPWRPAESLPAAVAALTGRWWWMGREHTAHWDARAEELVVLPVSTGPGEPWRFAREGGDRWRGTAGANHGEALEVRRDERGEVTGLEVAAALLTREPEQAG